jgi:hypothetical protein
MYNYITLNAHKTYTALACLPQAALSASTFRKPKAERFRFI